MTICRCFFASNSAGASVHSAARGVLRGNQPIDVAGRPSHSVLLSTATLEAALAEPAWEAVDMLPVVDRSGKLLGSIRRTVLHRALAAEAKPGADDKTAKYMSFADTLYVGLAGVLATSIAKPPQVGQTAAATGSKDQ